MPPEVWSWLTNAGPVAGIMGYMWWLERKERVGTQKKYEALLLSLPDKLTGFVDAQRASNGQLVEGFRKMTRAVWAAIGKTSKRPSPPGDTPSLLPPSGGDDDR